MLLEALLDEWRQDPAFSSAVDSARLAADAGSPVSGAALVCPLVAFPALSAALARHLGACLLVVTATGREAEDLAGEIEAFLGPEKVAVFPPWETLPHERLSPRAETVARRLALLHRLAHPSASTPIVVVAPARALMQRMAPGLDRLRPKRISRGWDRGLETLVDLLSGFGFARTDMVERRGEFAVRGGLVDFFPPAEEHPLRAEFWGDEVESLRTFAVASQRSLAEAAAAEVFPCRELQLTEEVRERAGSLVGSNPAAAEMLEMVAGGADPDGVEALLPLLHPDCASLLDYLPRGSHVLVAEPKRTRDRAGEMRAHAEEAARAAWSSAAEGAVAPIAAEGLGYWDFDEVLDRSGLPVWTVSPFRTEQRGERVLDVSAHEPLRADFERVGALVRELAAAGFRVLLALGGHGSAERVREALADQGLAVPVLGELGEHLHPGVAVVSAAIARGYLAPAQRLALLAEEDLLGARRATRESVRLPSRRHETLATLDLKPGDLVVHTVHGIGRYAGMEHRKTGESERDYLLVEYAQGDRLYVPGDQVDVLSKYVGGEVPNLTRLGTREWERSKARVRKAVREIAGELIRLHAARTAAEGHAFSPDTPWQSELEDAFPYVETPDQLGAIEEVKADMEAPVPMDRLVCGDVGYGKTEIAVRAAFKAVMDGKQVAVLVPTTLLAQQHAATFAERFAPFPVRVGLLSRFASPKEQELVLADLAKGSLDVVVGTHRLLQKDVCFADLGLVVVDEEQRFGVSHKEKLKQLRTSVDVLTMTATPIPRTLEMGVSGIKALSVIETPPEDRHPVLTFVMAYDETTLATAIRREMMREGQTFFVHNRVQTIHRVAARLAELVPEARIGVAHGQMPEEALERVMLEFWDKAYDVLLTTTIIESGLDIPTANTLIVDRADTLGLAQLYQLRGRVGRARERAYAYLFFKPEATMTESAHARLATLSQFTDLGSGMAIAMKDLEIRGAGSLLGAEQSGHIAAVGFDMYTQMLAEAVAEARKRPLEIRHEVKIELAVVAHLPSDYVPRERLRLEAYRRVAGARSQDELVAMKAELADRYGPLPEAVANLLDVAGLRLSCEAMGVREVIGLPAAVRVAPVGLTDSQQVRLRRLVPKAIYKALSEQLLLPLSARTGESPVVWLTETLEAILAPPAPQPSSTRKAPSR